MTGLFSKLNKRLPSRTVSSDAIPIARVLHNQPVPQNATPEELDRLVTQTPDPLEAELAQAAQTSRTDDPWSPLKDLIMDPTVTDLFITQPDLISYRKAGVPVAQGTITLSEPQYRAIIDDAECQLKARCKENCNYIFGPLSMPVHGQCSITHPHLNGSDWFNLHLRIPRIAPTFYDLIKAKMLPASLASWITEALAARCIHIVVCGAPQSGKTTLTATLTHAAPSEERIIAIEPAAELFPPSRRLDRLCQRHAPDTSASGGAQVLGGILEIALRSTPDRLVATHLSSTALAPTAHPDPVNPQRILQSAVPSILELNACTAESALAYFRGLESPLPIILIETHLHERKPIIRQVVEIVDHQCSAVVVFHSVVEGKRRWVRCVEGASVVRDLLAARGQELKLGPNLLDGFPEGE